MDSGPLEQRRATSWSRISSPSAAKMEAELGSALLLVTTSGGPPEVLLDRLHLRGPPTLVVLERADATRDRDLVEAGLHHRQQGSPRDLLQLEHDQGHGLVRDAYAWRRSPRMPAPREQPLGLHAFDGDVHGDVLVALVRDLALHSCTEPERVREDDPEPLPELLRVGESLPDLGAWMSKLHLLLDTVGRRRLHGASSSVVDHATRNRMVAC